MSYKWVWHEVGLDVAILNNFSVSLTCQCMTSETPDLSHETPEFTQFSRVHFDFEMEFSSNKNNAYLVIWRVLQSFSRCDVNIDIQTFE